MPENLNPEQQLEYLKELRKKYEEVLKDAEKSGDYSEAKRLKQELNERLIALEAQFSKLEPAEVIDKQEITYEKAREIMGEDFFGVDEIYKAFGEAVANSLDKHSEYYKLPYSERDLIEAKKNGEMLIARVGSYYPEPGTLHFMTMAELHDIAGFKMTPDDFKTIKGFGAISKELFYNSDTIKSRWVLVKKDFIPDSEDESYSTQTAILRDYLNNIGVLTHEEAESISHIALQEILNNPDNDRREKAKKLTEIPINQKYRRSPAEAFYDWMLLKSEKKDNKLYSNTYEFTNGLNSNGSIIATSINLQEFRCIAQSYDSIFSSIGVISAR